MTSTLQTLGHSLDQWQALYIVSVTLALLSTFAIVFFAFHKQHRSGSMVSNYIYVLASVLAVISTIVIVYKTKSLDAEKDRISKAASEANDLKLAQAKVDIANADKKAQEAKDETTKIEAENLKFGSQIGKDAATARLAEAALDAKNKQTSDFAHSLQQQQGIMAEQSKSSPQLTNFQIEKLANLLKPYAGAQVDIDQTAETVVGRLASAIHGAFNLAGVKTNHKTTFGALYQGVSVAVHSPNDVPPIAIALMNGLRQAGVDAHPVTVPNQVNAGGVTIFIGPN